MIIDIILRLITKIGEQLRSIFWLNILFFYKYGLNTCCSISMFQLGFQAFWGNVKKRLIRGKEIKCISFGHLSVHIETVLIDREFFYEINLKNVYGIFQKFTEYINSHFGRTRQAQTRTGKLQRNVSCCWCSFSSHS